MFFSPVNLDGIAEGSALQPLLEQKVRYLFTDTEASSIKKASPSGSKKFLWW